MSYQATVIPIMIASPGDVAVERDIIREVIHDWNDVNSANSKVMLAPIGWESHTSPELGRRPQEIINKRILKQCDLLVGVFWTRLGTPTGKAASGTVEEIEEHRAAGKPAMIYFSTKPVSLETVDIKQYQEKEAFKEKLKNLGLVEEFENEEQFRALFAKQLPITLIHNEYLQKEIATTPKLDVMIEDEKKSSVSVSLEGQQLLRECAAKGDGTIMKIEYIGGKNFQAGGKQFGAESSRQFAKYESALEELINFGLVIARGHKDQIFELTHKGWSLADDL